MPNEESRSATTESIERNSIPNRLIADSGDGLGHGSRADHGYVGIQGLHNFPNRRQQTQRVTLGPERQADRGGGSFHERNVEGRTGLAVKAKVLDVSDHSHHFGRGRVPLGHGQQLPDWVLAGPEPRADASFTEQSTAAFAILFGQEVASSFQWST